MQTRRLLLGALAVALVSTACSSGGDNSVTTSAASAPSSASTSAPATTTAGGTSTSEETSVEDQAQAALLTPAEVGPGFTAGTWTASDPKQPTPCGTPSVDSTLPPQLQVGTVIGLASTQQALQEEISLYTAVEEATAAFQTGSAGRPWSAHRPQL